MKKNLYLDFENLLAPMDVSEMIILDDYLVITCRSTVRNITVGLLVDGTKVNKRLFGLLVDRLCTSVGMGELKLALLKIKNFKFNCCCAMKI